MAFFVGSEAGRKLVQKLMDKSLVIEIGKLLALPDTEISEVSQSSTMSIQTTLLTLSIILGPAAFCYDHAEQLVGANFKRAIQGYHGYVQN
jgi:hypothetical protein